MIAYINAEREANGLSRVGFSEELNGDATKMSRDVRVSPVVYRTRAPSAVNVGQNILVIPKITWAVSIPDSQQQLFKDIEKEDTGLRDNILDPAYDLVGIGVSSDVFNYYIVTSWGQEFGHPGET